MLRYHNFFILKNYLTEYLIEPLGHPTGRRLQGNQFIGIERLALWVDPQDIWTLYDRPRRRLMSDSIFSGCIPALMTPCKADRTPDFDALVRKGQSLIASGMRAVVYCGSMGDWPLLTDEQRMEGVEQLVKAGVPMDIVAKQLGHANMLTVMNTYGHLAEQYREEQVREKFSPLDEEQCAERVKRQPQLDSLWSTLQRDDWRTYANMERGNHLPAQSFARPSLEVLEVFEHAGATIDRRS